MPRASTNTAPLHPKPPVSWAWGLFLGWLGAATVGALEVGRLVTAGPVNPGPVAAAAGLLVAVLFPGVLGLATVPLARWLRPTSDSVVLGAGAGTSGLLVAGLGGLVGVVGVGLFVVVAVPGRVAGRWRVAAWGVGVTAWMLAPLVGGPPPADGPSVLLITVADARGDLRESGVDMQALTELSAGGVSFSHAYAPSASGGASLTAILTGTAPWTSGVMYDGDQVDEPETLAADLASRGWRTAAFVQTPLAQSGQGLFTGFQRLDDESSWLVGGEHLALGRLLGIGGDRRGADVTVDRAARWVRRQDRPWFAWVHLDDLRGPLDPPQPYDERYHPPGGNGTGAPWLGEHSNPGRVPGLWQGTADWVDHELLTLLRSVPDDTIVVWVGTNGVAQGERDVWWLPCGEEADWHVPLTIRAHGVTVGGAVDQPVETALIAATLRDLTGVDGDVEGSLAGTLEGGGVRVSGARSVSRVDEQWIVSVRTRYGRATRGAESRWVADETETPFDESTNPLRTLAERRAEALLEEVVAAPEVAGPPPHQRAALVDAGFAPR